MSKSKRFALLWCSEEERLDYRNEMVDAFKMKDAEWEIISVFSDLMQIIDDYDGFMISGSEYSVNEDKERFTGLFDFIRAANKKEKPIVGICFGCQSLAVALGGEVDFNPDGQFRFGADNLDFIEGIAPKIGLNENNIKLIESHGECVSALPPDAVLIASSDSAAVEVFSLGAHILAVQGHPELSKEIVEQDFLKVHLEEGNINESGAKRLKAELVNYQPPESIRKLIKDTLQKKISFKDLVEK